MINLLVTHFSPGNGEAWRVNGEENDLQEKRGIIREIGNPGDL